MQHKKTGHNRKKSSSSHTYTKKQAARYRATGGFKKAKKSSHGY